MNSVRLAARNFQIAGPSCTSRENNGIVDVSDILYIDIDTHVRIWNKCLDIKLRLDQPKNVRVFKSYHTLGGHEIQAALYDLLVQLHAKNELR